MSWSEALFSPRSVAVVGSVGEGKIGRVLLDQLVEGGFTELWAVNPKVQGIPGVPAVSSFSEIDSDQMPDLAVIASPAATVASVLEDAGSAGVKVGIIITAGFSESGNREEELNLHEIAQMHGMRLVGPNCAGIVNTHHKLFPTLETRPPAGNVAFISQSGALGGAVLSWAESQGIGFSKFASYGNAVDLQATDFLDALREDKDTAVVALYIETLPAGREFMEAASALSRVKPLIVIKSGRSASGGRATQSHTGSLAGSDAVFDAALTQCGAIRVSGIEEMFDLCRGFSFLGELEGPRVAVVTNSGGPGVLAVDAADAVGLEVAPPSLALKERLAARLQPFCSLGNPFDLTVQATETEYRETLMEVLKEYDAAIAMNVNVPYMDVAPLAHGVVDAAATTGKPIAASFAAGEPAAAALPVLQAGGVPNFVTGERCATTLSGMLERNRWLELDREDKTGPVLPLSETRTALPWNHRPTEPEAMEWLEPFGFPVIERVHAMSAMEAVHAQQRFGCPVALKLVSPVVVHKTDLGGVALGLSSPDDIVRAFERFRAIAPKDSFEGALVTPMIEDPVEVLVGLHNDPQFGPVVVVGMGGVYTEIFADVAMRVAPVSRNTAMQMIESLQGVRLLQGARGTVLRDLSSLASLVAAVSRLPLDVEGIQELDLNPVFLLEHGCVIGDVRLIPDRNDSNSQRSNN